MPEYDGAAERAAVDWLALADAGDAAGTYAAAASLFRRAVADAQWSQALDAARAPLGPVIMRTLLSRHATRELPGAPDGEYVVFEFATQFAHKRAAVETITPMRDVDGQWRVSGYFIR